MTDKLRKAAQQIIDAWNYGSPFEKYLVALDEALDHSGETNEMVAPDGYALISIDALKAWGKYGELLNACLFPAEQAEQEPVKRFTSDDVNVAFVNGYKSAMSLATSAKEAFEIYGDTQMIKTQPVSQELSEREITKPKQRTCKCGDKCFPIFSGEREYCKTCGWPIYTFDEHQAKLLEEKK